MDRYSGGIMKPRTDSVELEAAAYSMPGVLSGRRMAGLDAFRGFIMVLMALDHASYFIAKTHSHEFWGAELPHYPGAMEFLTRWVSHLCAPGFFLVMGIGVVMLVSSREKAGWSAGRISRFFMIRGALLILIQFFVENPA